jgi:CBS domain-containing protein
MQTQEMMSANLVVIHQNDSMIAAFKLMKQKAIRHLPVMNDEQQLVGILSDRDVQRSMCCTKINAYQQEVAIEEHFKVADFMSPHVYTLDGSTPLETAAEVMLKRKVSALLVRGSNQHYGIITTDDLLAYMVQVMKEQKFQSWTLEACWPGLAAHK